MKIEISIIIPVFNKLDYTRKCLEVLYKNTDVTLKFEVIVVDNGSIDKTAVFFKTAKIKYLNLVVITNKKNLGFARACNIGAKAAKGKYILFLNNDTEPQSNWLPPLIEILEKDSTTAAVGCKLIYPDLTIQHAGIIFISDSRINTQPEPIHINYGWPEDLPAANYKKTFQAVTAACMLIRKKMFKDVKGFDETYYNGYEDIDLCLKVWENDKKVIYQPQSIVIHHESKSGIERQLKK